MKETEKKVDQVDALVICSTLNQITNYLLIKLFKPNKVINITLESNSDKFTKINIKNKKWDDYLDSVLKKELDIGITNSIELNINQLKNLNKIKRVLKKTKFDVLKDKSKTVYWNVTGGQRTIALAVQQFINDNARKKDKMLYVEGNTEKLLIMNENEFSEKEYSDRELNLETALKLVGFKNFDKGNKNLLTGQNEEEYQLFLKLYNIIKDKDFKLESNGEEMNLRDHLIKSNKEEAKKDYLNQLFEDLKEKDFNGKLNEEEILTCEDVELLFSKDSNKNYKYIKGSYPAGSIFEKITGYKILEIIKRKNYNIVDMRLNYKTRNEFPHFLK